MRYEQETDKIPQDIIFSQSSALATLDPADDVDARQPEWTGPQCAKCNAPIKSDVVAICRSCGWYASLGTFVELDPDWESDPDANEVVTDAPQLSHLGVWLNLLPRWSWVIIATMLAVIVESVLARLVTPAGSSLRTAWSLAQLAIGVLAVAGCHVFNFLVVAAADADFGVLDLFLKPFKLWTRAVRNLPARLWVANTAASGLTAFVMSLVVIGGIPYERLWDWGFEAPPKQNLMGAVMDRVKELDSRNGADDLEEAVGDFAGSQNVEPGADLPKPTPEKPRGKVDCVILGYKVDRDGRLATLLLGTAHRGELMYAGSVTPNLPDDELAKLLQRLAAIKRPQAFIAIQADATWVQPNLTCRVSFGERQKGGRLRDLQWDKLLGSVNLPQQLR